ALGPTFHEHFSVTQFSGAVVRLENQLNPNQEGFGSPRLTTHVHGGHHPARSDGFPTNINFNGHLFPPLINPREHFDGVFPLMDPGFLSATDDPGERSSSLWYHDHIIDFTGPNVYRGLAGFIRVFDSPLDRTPLDVGDENAPVGLRLPSGPFDV